MRPWCEAGSMSYLRSMRACSGAFAILCRMWLTKGPSSPSFWKGWRTLRRACCEKCSAAGSVAVRLISAERVLVRQPMSLGSELSS